ncbi:hypothetical protein PtA15_17A225 [Puccinia triticina]|uniref:BZIP domain-containing protein n=1 Tax=Puccinia triticina TaxID=208348 RepID=A0ABY7D845_9BASI|nr:uncharacterized protein PtA15_17A225 [Puccinia triticina]WAQ92743.1 hypothetical protein PtA15_17A225 [Puccinia triticina]
MMERQINNYLDLSPRQPGSSSPITFEQAPTPGLSSLTQEEGDVDQNEEPVPPESNHHSPSRQSTHPPAEPTSSSSEPKQQQQAPLCSDPPPEHSAPNPSKSDSTKTTSHTAASSTTLKKLNNAQNAPQTSTKKPVKPSFKKVNNKGTTTTGFPAPSNPSATSTPKPAAANPKPAAKPVQPGNLPPQASLFNNSAVDRLEARKKRRAEEKRILNQQMKVGFDLLRQNMDMMDFEIEYKNHVRAMVERPLSPEYLPKETSENGSGGGGSWKPEAGPTGGIPSGSQGVNGGAPANVFRRPDGYTRYLNPPPPSSLPASQTIPPTLSHQPPGPIYSSSFPPHLPKKTLPRPGMFGSTFFIWQPPHLP